MKNAMATNNSEIKNEDVYRAYKTAAKIVSTYGDIYLPIFQRLHDEVQKLEENKKIKILALEMDKS